MFAELNDTHLFYEFEGTAQAGKPTVILIPGGPGFDHVYFKPFFSALTDVARVMYYDPRGCGQSDKGQEQDFTLKQWTDDIVHLVQNLQIEQPVFLGHSFGGFVAQNVAITYPDVPHGIILCNSAGRFDLEVAANRFQALHGEASEIAVRQFFADVSSPDAATAYNLHCEKKYNHTRRPEGSPRASFNPQAFSTFYRAQTGEGFHFSHLDALEHVKAPTLILAGQHDPILPFSLSQEVGLHLPQDRVHLHILPDCGHEVYLDQPQLAFPTMRRFVTQLKRT